MQRMTRRTFFHSAGLAAAVPAVGAVVPAGARQGSQPDIRIENDVVFGKGGEMDLLLDIYRPPAGTEKRMAVVHVHGGGFSGGSKAGVQGSANAFASTGYVGIASQYRLTGQGRWPAQIHDVKAAIRWTRANADRLDIDPEHVAVAGYSAGGLMALVAAGTPDLPELEGGGGNNGVSSRVAACVAFYPAVAANAGLMPEGSDAAAREAASAATYISDDFAPTIFLHGVEDTTIPFSASLNFFNRLHDAGVNVDLHLFQGAPHAFPNSNPDAALAAAQVADLFFERLILNPREYPPFGFGGGGPGPRGGRGGGGRGGRGGDN